LTSPGPLQKLKLNLTEVSCPHGESRAEASHPRFLPCCRSATWLGGCADRLHECCRSGVFRGACSTSQWPFYAICLALLLLLARQYARRYAENICLCDQSERAHSAPPLRPWCLTASRLACSRIALARPASRGEEVFLRWPNRRRSRTQDLLALASSSPVMLLPGRAKLATIPVSTGRLQLSRWVFRVLPVLTWASVTA
jgi:hypothetical protein